MRVSWMNMIWLVWTLVAWNWNASSGESRSTVAAAFVPSKSPTRTRVSSPLPAAPQRLADNVEGVVYVNDRCINCAACSNFAPSVFQRATSDTHHIVHRQPDPTNPVELDQARAALSACPVAAIRVETDAHRHHNQLPSLTEAELDLVSRMALSPKHNHLDLPFPRKFFQHDNIYWVGHHNEASFGATPYLVKVDQDGQDCWIMVDTPKYSKSAVDTVTSVTGDEGPRYLLLTHVDDTADHGKWVERFPSLQRVFHSGDLGRHNWIGDTTLEHVEILLSNENEDGTNGGRTDTPLTAYTLDGTKLSSKDIDQHTAVIFHTPGHSPGSISLWCRDEGVLFTGDTYTYTTRTNSMSGMPRYGNDLHVQSETLEKVVQLPWTGIAPGHGHPRDYSNEANVEQAKHAELQDALKELRNHRKW